MLKLNALAGVSRVGFPGLAVAAIAIGGCMLTRTPCGQPTDGQAHPALAARLESLRAAHDLPALGAAIIRPNGTVEVAAVGWREAGAAACVSTDDRFHLGSCGKAMTATMLAALVEEGRLNWGSRLEEVFTDLAPGMHPGFREVTLLQLLTHRAGLPDDRADDATQDRIDAAGGTLTEKRLAMVRARTAVAPVSAPGAEYRYSNAGYEIAGAMAERVTGQTYEDLMRARVFGPLGMSTAGFGAPGRPDVIDEPRGHRTVLGAVMPVRPGPAADNPLFTAPSGGMHCSLSDWAAFAAAHLAGARGTNGLLAAETFATLHTPTGDYACGWQVAQTAPFGRALIHDGGNTMWYAVIYVLPEVDAAVMLATNRGDEASAWKVVDMINTLALEIVQQAE